jgi:hypothetical protein
MKSNLFFRTSLLCRGCNVWAIQRYQKTYLEISWDYPFNHNFDGVNPGQPIRPLRFTSLHINILRLYSKYNHSGFYRANTPANQTDPHFQWNLVGEQGFMLNTDLGLWKVKKNSVSLQGFGSAFIIYGSGSGLLGECGSGFKSRPKMNNFIPIWNKILCCHQ